MGVVQSRTRLADSGPVTEIIRVHQISPASIGREIIRRFGNAGQWQYLDDSDLKTLEFLQAAISGISQARMDNANLSNAAFILSQPGREIILKAGNGDWEYHFTQGYSGITGVCVRKPLLRYIWDHVKKAVSVILPAVGGSAMRMLPWNR